jgi:hypothetical protein
METTFDIRNRRGFRPCRLTIGIIEELPPNTNGFGDFGQPEPPGPTESRPERIAGNMTGTGHFEQPARLDPQELRRPRRIDKWFWIHLSVHRSPPNHRLRVLRYCAY